MADLLVCKEKLLALVALYRKKYELSKEVGADYYEPGMMENLEQYRGSYDEETGQIEICCASKGMRYENRTVNLERVSVGEPVLIIRETSNTFNPNNFTITTIHHASLGNLSADLCNALGPLYDAGRAQIISSHISYIEKIVQRSRYAKQGVLFVKLVIQLKETCEIYSGQLDK